ncbi:MAG: nuclear transport factor 2 family protein [Saprospiraceae bacterium]|jgi:ketosteroid isomerase-like protein|nr:nuclear transport factor 2 family protein [Saprospiraceae bacterium]MBK6477749.1 nuclear transport factor 2 family protein [Saprospiraceae bacterium]MBK6816373.1 nuclear transport factor 2 family protein [Saprospiraceae bacterium]MBK7370481.1 nuclear transport factor 2 family protein [Saprospiraceae bacterium]MBK7438198.1 nuclear transport factor 2 family protein [Saprospiraceae bacterium]
MNFKSILILAGLFIIGSYSCTSPVAEKMPVVDTASVKAEIQALEDAYAKAEMAKDADAVVAYYAEDAISMPNNEPKVMGKANILNRLKMNMAKDSTLANIAFVVEDIMVAGACVIETGKSTSTNTSGKVTAGKYISIFEKRDGKYVCVKDIFNEDAAEK